MAHRIWAVYEIVGEIASILVYDRQRKSAVALAMCSKSLEDPALAKVWRNLSSLSPLVRCFPPDIWEVIEGKLASGFRIHVI
jgi:long-subunit acyl-CoA synthetase (AMP-forming)